MIFLCFRNRDPRELQGGRSRVRKSRQGWVTNAKLEQKSKLYYQDGWRFPGSASNVNCALRTLRRMLHRAEEWKILRRAPKLKLAKEYGRALRLDAATERKLLDGAAACEWRKKTLELFTDIIILMRDTGMRNERKLYRVQIEKHRLAAKRHFCTGQQNGERKKKRADE